MNLNVIIRICDLFCSCSFRVLGIALGVGSWFTPITGRWNEIFIDVLKSERLRTPVKYIIILIIFIPVMILFTCYYIVSFRFIPDLLFKDRNIF